MTEKESYKKISDKVLIKHILQSGETSLFGELYDRYANKVYRKCISMLKNKEDAQDLAHDILVKAFLNIAKFEGNSSFSTWIYAITYNQCIDFLRNKQKARFVEFEHAPDALDREDNTEIEEKEIFEIEVERLTILIHELSEEDRAILLMKYQDDMSVEDIRRVWQLSNSAVKMRLKRARDRLRKLYVKKYGNN